MTRNLYIKTYGCQMNVYDSQKIADLLLTSHGMQLVITPDKADLIVLNTCAVRGKAEEKLFSDLGRLRLIKKKHPEIIIGVGGCVATQEGKNILTRAPYVDFVFGPQTLHHIPLLYDEVVDTKRHLINIELLKNEKFKHFPEPIADGPSAFVTIMEGCNRFCSYCVVPHTRGPEISRPFEDVINECTKLSSQGVKEIHFLGQNVNAYRYKTKDLTDLLSKVAEDKNIARLRFTTSHPTSFSKRLMTAFANEPKIVNHLHLPVQSGSNRILKVMRRNYTTEQYKEKIAAVRALLPDISISSDFIVGFPNETEADFQETLNFVSEVNFDHSFSFIYSPRPNTKAALMDDTISLPEKKQRLQTLQNLLTAQENVISQAMLNTTQEILVTGTAIRKDHQQLMGRTENNRIVNFVNNTNQNLIGKIISVKITKILRYSLRGEVASS